MKSEVFENWMIYVSDRQAEEFEEVLDDMAESIEGFALGISICDCGNVATYFKTRLEDGQEYSFSGYEITEGTDGILARRIVEANYEIYINLLWKLHGIKPFMNFDRCVSFETYLNAIKETIEKEYDKEQCRGGCEACSVCCYAYDEIEEEC